MHSHPATFEEAIARGFPLTQLEELATAQAEDQQRRLGKKVSARSYHMFFVGNPGTGKTVVARLVSKLFRAAGLRSSRLTARKFHCNQALMGLVFRV